MELNMPTSPPSTRSSSGSRHRSRSRNGRRRHSRRRHRRSRSRRKFPERNILAAAFSMVAIVGISAALAEPEWFTFHGGNCHDELGNYLPSIGVSIFFSPGGFNRQHQLYHYTIGSSVHTMTNCLSQNAVVVMQIILASCLLSALCTLAAFIMDLIGPKQLHLMTIRRCGLLNIIGFLLLVLVCGMCYWAAILMYDVQHSNKLAKGSKVEVAFGSSYFIIISAAVSNIMATACNLLRRYPPAQSHSHRDEQSRPIMNDMDLETILVARDEPPTINPNSQPPPYVP